MNRTWQFALTVILAAAAALAALVFWLGHEPALDLRESVPGQDHRPPGPVSPARTVHIGELFAAGPGQPGPVTAPWPHFRGPDFDNLCRQPVRLLERWDSGGPPRLWSVELGEGHGGAAVMNGRVYVLDYDEAAKADMLRCVSLADGREIWRRGYRVQVKRNHGMSRTVPGVTDKYVVTMGPRAHVMCVDAVTGDLRWGLDLQKDWGTKEPLWYTGQCPWIDGDVAVLAPGGKALLMGVACADGQIVWQTPNPHGWQMSHSSVMPMTFGGRRMYVYCAIGGMVGVAADGADRGTVLWETRAWDAAVIAPSPLCMPDGRIFVTAGYGAGSMLFRLQEENGRFTVTLVQRWKPDQALACEQQTPFYVDGQLFGIMPKDGGAHRNEFVCAAPNDPGRLLWTSGKAERFGLGPFIVADGRFFILDDDGELTMARATAAGWEPLGRARILNGHDAWAPIAIADGRFILRDSKQMVCLDLRAAR